MGNNQDSVIATNRYTGHIHGTRRINRMMGASLGQMLASADYLHVVHRSSLRMGDWILVKTLNSRYSIRTLEGGAFAISGGWFDRHQASPVTMRIRGCTWGGTAIKTDIIAACGLRIEFENRLITSPIQKIFVFSRETGN